MVSANSASYREEAILSKSFNNLSLSVSANSASYREEAGRSGALTMTRF